MKDFEIIHGHEYWFYNKTDSAHGQRVIVTGVNEDGPELEWLVRFDNDGEPFAGFVKASELRNHPVDALPVTKIRAAITMLKTMNDGKYPAWVFDQVGKDAQMIITVLESGLVEDGS